MSSAKNSESSTPWPHFTAEEFYRAVPSCGPLQMDSSFMDAIERIRERSGVPMHVNSAYRSSQYEFDHGRSGNSYHCTGQALDVRCTNSVSRYKLIEAMMHFGELSAVIYPGFIHFDSRPLHKLMIQD